MSAQAIPFANRGDPLPDHVLLTMLRAGDIAAFGELFLRHKRVAEFVARAESDNSNDAGDVAGEAFAAVFQAILEGKGPVDLFRPYLLVTVRRMAHGRNLQARRMAALRFIDPRETALWSGDQLASHESVLLVRAFQSLPRRWQEVLWYLEVEDLKPAGFLRHLGRYVRNGLGGNAKEKVRRHVLDCPRCASVLMELQEIHGTMTASGQTRQP